MFITALVAALLSSMSGGGQSAINVPVLLWLGVSFPLAALSQKISSVFWTPIAAFNYLKDRTIKWKFVLLFGGVGLIGVYYGTVFITIVNQRTFEIIVGTLILLLAFYTFIKKDLGLREEKVYSKFRKGISYVFALVLGFYEGIFGAGNGIMFPIVILATRGFDFVDALGYYYIVSFPWCLFAAVILISKGYLNLTVVIPVTVGSVIGGYAGSKYAKYKGNKFIKMMFVVIGTLLGIKLLLGF